MIEFSGCGGSHSAEHRRSDAGDDCGIMPSAAGMCGHRAGFAAAIAVAAMLAMPASGQAQKATPEEGRRLAETYCARCHVVDPGGGAGWTDAPAFAVLANDPKISRAWLRDFVKKPHMHMLNTERSPAEADAIAAYLLSMRRRD